jgi:hypothetical protein
MQMRIIWGKILPGQWDAFEAAFKKALEIRGDVKGLRGNGYFGTRMIPMRDIRSRSGKALTICGRSGTARSATRPWPSFSRST